MAHRFFPSGWWRATRHPLKHALGHLEAEVMEVLWRRGEIAVRDAQAELSRPIAYTTVMTTLDRLYKKGIVSRRREGRAFLYTAAYARNEMEVTVTSDLVSDLLADDAAAATPLLSNLVDVVADRDGRLLDELERLVRDKREQLKKERAS